MAAPYGFPEHDFSVWQPPIYQQPRVGLAVVCRCLADGSVECLLQRRGQHSHTPGKWSFPGGRLDQEGDLEPAEDFGAGGTLRELGEECGGGTPLGLPSLIHIMRMYNDPNPDGKAKQTMYHVYAVDLEKEPDWAHWQPRPMRGHEEEVDTSPTELIINGNPVRCTNGQCWVNLEQLCIQCCQKMQSLDQSSLHPGLVKWVQNHAMNILKYLIARSPKIARAIQKPQMTGSGGAVMAPRFNRSGSGGRTKRRQSSSSMLAPPLLPGQAVMQPYLPVVNPLLSGVDLSQMQPVSNIQVSIPSQSPAQEVLTNKQAMPPDSSITGTQPKPFPSMTPLTIQTQQQQQQLIQEQQQQQQSHQVAENVPATSIGTFPQMPVQGSPYYPANQKQPLMSLTPDEQQQLALLQLLSEQQQQQMLVAAANMGLPPRSLSSTRDVPCSYFFNGSCLYGDKCWYSHAVLPSYPMMSSQQPPLMSPQSATSHDVYTYPQQPTVDQNYYYMPSPPQSPLAYFPNSPTWPIGGGNRSSFVPYQARMPSGVHPNNSRFMFTRFPVNQAAVRMQQGAAAAAAFMAANGPQVTKRGDQSSLKFALVSEIPINSDMSQLPITHLTTRGDHFYITLDNVLRDYRISLQPFRVSASGQTYMLKDTSTLPQVVSYLYCSRDTGQLFIGTKNGSIYRWDTKHSERIDICVNDLLAAVTSLIHFYTSLGSQIVVSGNCVGVVTWYIMQPPQKTFTVLLTDHRHEPHSVTSIQLLGSILLSGSVDGTVHCWNMQSSRPVITATIRAHSVSLSKIHVINSQHFVTIGNNSDLPISLSVESADTGVANEPKSSSSTSGVDKAAVTPDDLATSVIKLALESSGGDKSNGRTTTPVVTLWKFENPPKSVKTFSEFGTIISSSILVTKFAGSFLAMALQRGSIVVYHVPDFTALPEFPADVTGVTSCKLLSLSLARELPSQSPSREIMLTVVQSDNTVKVYQVK